jgi:hypothetical protein
MALVRSTIPTITALAAVISTTPVVNLMMETLLQALLLAITYVERDVSINPAKEKHVPNFRTERSYHLKPSGNDMGIFNYRVSVLRIACRWVAFAAKSRPPIVIFMLPSSRTWPILTVEGLSTVSATSLEDVC